MDILTQNPEVWKKTIFILTYDENDGYFDHVPPFIAPDIRNNEAGKVSAGIDSGLEQVFAEIDLPGSIGLGFRVPLVIASPWSRGGWVNSEVFDHTSSIQFLEHFLNKKFGKNIEEKNITKWRRTVCGDLTSVFRKYNGEKMEKLPFLAKDVFIEGIHNAKFKNVPNNFKSLTKEEIKQVSVKPESSPFMPKQESGTKNSCALPYELYVDGALNADKNLFSISMRVGNIFFREQSAGCPFIVYTYGKEVKAKHYTVAAGDQLFDETLLNEFGSDNYDIHLLGPNGFFRQFKGNKNNSRLLINFEYEVLNQKPTGRILMKFINPDTSKKNKIRIVDNAYKTQTIIQEIPGVNEKSVTTILIDPKKNGGWYDFSIFTKGNDSFENRYAGRVETGKHSITDPVMGGVI
jgi:phospholipase C